MSNPYQESYWRNHLEAQEQSGQTKTEYCRQHKLTLSAFYTWRKKLSPPNPTCQSVHPIVVAQPSLSSSLEQQLTLTLPGEYQLTFSERLSPDVLKRFVAVLR